MSAAAVAAGAMAVESQNIVGTQDFNGQGTFNLTVGTFVPVGTDGADMSITNFSGNASFGGGSDAVSLYTSQGFFVKALTYYEGDDELDAGWYEIDDFNDSDLPTLITDEAIPYGSGFVFNRRNASSAVNYHGEVADGSTLPAPGTFNFVGNTIPEQKTLAALSGNASFGGGSDAISLYTPTGFFIKSLTYYEGDNELDAGWYEIDDFNDSDLPTPLTNTTQLQAGEGFIFNRRNAAARVVVASPL